ncbi:hypothetical protein EU537_05880 [Candidatus Thorarchaeota archaeon]|nr:MAG: hypothetical protein EU537_05880 [Candidatus Thorarchaeota archaeon]
MSNQTTSFGTIYENLKSSLRMAKNNMLSYFLANLGMAIVLVLIVMVIAIPIVALFLLTGPVVWTEWGQWMANTMPHNPGAIFAIGGVGILIMLPFAAAALVVVGSIFGMSKEVVETGETKAESAFSWFRRKFLTFAGTGVILTLIILVPQGIVYGLVSWAMDFQVTGVASIVLSVFSFIYTFITVGFCLMVIPSVVNGQNVQDAFKESFNLAKKNFERVFGLLSGLIVFFVLVYSPVIIGGLLIGPNPAMALNPAAIFIGIWAVIAGLLTLLLFLPMAVISIVKVYHEITGGQVYEPTAPEVPMM